MRYKTKVGKCIDNPDGNMNGGEQVVEYTPTEKNQDEADNYTKNKTDNLVFRKRRGKRT